MHRTAALAALLLLLPCALEAACPPPGDVSPAPAGDGAVTVGDVLLALRWATGLEQPPTPEAAELADVAPVEERDHPLCRPCPLEAGGDGRVDVLDVVALLRASAGWPLEWPLRESSSAYRDAPEHVAIRWLAPGLPAACDGPGVAGHADRAAPWLVEPCAATSTRELRHPTDGRVIGLEVECSLEAASNGAGAVSYAWRGPEPHERAVERLEVRTPAGAWLRVQP